MILVVGGTGTLGRQVVRRLLANGHSVRVLTRQPERGALLAASGAEVVTGDLRDPASLRAATQGVRAVVSSSHSIAGAWRSSSARVDDAGQRSLIAAAVEADIDHFVFISGHGASTTHPIDFWRTKARIEAHLKSSGLHFTILRPGAFLDFHAFELVGKAVMSGRRVVLFGPGQSPRNFIAADDVAVVVVRALEDVTLRGETITMGGPENLSMLEVVRVFENVAGKPARVTHLPLPVVRALIKVATPLHSGVRRILQLALLAETTDNTFDPAPFLSRFPMHLTRLEEWARERHRRNQESLPNRAAPED